MTCESQSLKHFNQRFWAKPRVVVLLASEPRTVSEKVNYPSNVIPKKNKRFFAVFFWATLFSFLKILFLDFHIFKMVLIFSQVMQRNRVMRKRSSTWLEFHKRTGYFLYFILVFIYVPQHFSCNYCAFRTVQDFAR